MATQEQIEKILALIDGIRAIPIDTLVSNNAKWGSINFEAARGDIELLFMLCGHLKVLPIEILPDPVANSFITSITQAYNVVAQINVFNIESGNPTGQRDSIITHKSVIKTTLIGALAL